jgi:hypothetical protein
MTGNAQDAGFVEMNLGFLDSGDLQQVKGGRIEKEKRNGRKYPN